MRLLPLTGTPSHEHTAGLPGNARQPTRAFRVQSARKQPTQTERNGRQMSLERCLIIGCGGSGAKTLAYMMDHLRSILPPEFGDELPAGWQFVTVDVPVSEESGPEGIPNVSAYRNGSYVGLGPSVGMYRELDSLVSNGPLNAGKPGADLGGIASWAPKDPQNLNILLSEGAGQLRAVGRMVTLSSLGKLRQGLESARKAMLTGDNDLYRLADLLGGKFKADAPAPLVLVVSSMAGGAGASMTVDVCRVLTNLPRIDPNKVALFLATPDTFTGLDESDRRGVFGNALAMIGEMVSAQAGRAGDDVRLMRDFKVEVKDSFSVGRVFPVGRTRGLNQAEIGRWPTDVYRALGRGLGALLSSPKALEPFVTYDMTNPAPTPGGRFESFGWGLPQRELEWYSFGYSSLSMGRERYQEYAAQRLARRSIDHLLDGYMTGVPLSVTGDMRLSDLANRAQGEIETRIGLKNEHQNYGEWLSLVGWPGEQLGGVAKALVDETQRALPDPQGQQASGWLGAIRAQLAERRQMLQERINAQVELRLWEYQRFVTDATIAVVADAVAAFGLPYAAEVLSRVDSAVAILMETAKAEGEKQHALMPAVATLDDKVASLAASIKGIVANGTALVQEVREGLQRNTRAHLRVSFTSHLVGLLADFRTGFLQRLRDEIEEQRRLLAGSRQETGQTAPGVARVDSPFYEHWPRGDEPVPARFGQAANEVLVTEPDQYLAQYDQDISRAVSPDQVMSVQTAQEEAARLIVTGEWDTGDGSPAPGGLIVELDRWVPKMFLKNPETRENLHPRPLTVRLCVSGEEILARARQFVARRTYSFDQFCSASLRSYIVDAPASQQASRRSELVAKFRTVLENAKPLCAIDPSVVQEIYGVDVEFRYKFSDIPFAGDPLEKSLENHLVSSSDIKYHAGDWQPDNPLSTSNAFRIDVFGSYSHYAPIVYASLINPIRADYLNRDKNFWTLRRARPLSAALAVSEGERRALIGGWFVGQITGRLSASGVGTAQPAVSITPAWRHNDRTTAGERPVDFPRLLTVPPEGQGLDLLACVLEAHLAAVTGVAGGVDRALAPYVALRELFQRGPYDHPQDSSAELLREVLRGRAPIPNSRVYELSDPVGSEAKPGFDGRKGAVVRFLEQRQVWYRSLELPITTRSVASAAPLSVDIANEAVSVLSDLIESVKSLQESSVPTSWQGGHQW